MASGGAGYSSRLREARLGPAIRGGDTAAAAAGGHAGERGTGEMECRGFIGVRRPEIWQAGARRHIGLGLVFEPRLPMGERDWADQRVPQFSEQGEEGRGKERRKRPRV
jgi:hypothetical protein